jgi:cytochrome c556
MPHIRGNGKDTRDKIAKHVGKSCERVRAVVPDDDAWDAKAAKTVVKLEDGSEVVLFNDEIGD